MRALIAAFGSRGDVQPMLALALELLDGLRGIAYALRALPRLVALQYAALEPLARRCDVMLGSSLTAAGASFAELHPLRYHYVSFTPCVIPSAEHPNLFKQSQSLPRWLNRLSWWQYRIQNKPCASARGRSPRR